MRAPVPAQALLSASMGAHFCKIKCWAAKSGHISKWLTCYVNDFPYTCTAGRESSASLLKMCRTKHSSSLLKMRTKHSASLLKMCRTKHSSSLLKMLTKHLASLLKMCRTKHSSSLLKMRTKHSASLLKMCRTKHSSSLLKMCRTMCVKLGFEYSKGVRRFDTGFFFFRSVHIPFGPLCKNKTARVQLS